MDCSLLACALFELVVLTTFAVWRDVIPPGILIYLHLLLGVSCALWITKVAVDGEATRYTLFLVFSVSMAVAICFALITPWLTPIDFWGTGV